MTPLRFVAVLSLCSFAAPAFAQDTVYTRPGPYLGVHGFAAFENFNEVDFDDGAGSGIRAGYRLHPHFATELQFDHYEDFDIDESFVDGEVDGYSISAQAKYLFPLPGERIQPFFFLGAGLLHGDLDDSIPIAGVSVSGDTNEFFWRVGAGVDLYATENVVVGVEAVYNFPTGDLDDFEFWTLGAVLAYRF